MMTTVAPIHLRMYCVYTYIIEDSTCHATNVTWMLPVMLYVMYGHQPGARTTVVPYLAPVN